MWIDRNSHAHLGFGRSARTSNGGWEGVFSFSVSAEEVSNHPGSRLAHVSKIFTVIMLAVWSLGATSQPGLLRPGTGTTLRMQKLPSGVRERMELDS